MLPDTDLIKQLGELALATRMKRLGDMLQADMQRLYEQHNIEFEPKWFTMLYALYHHPGMSIGELAAYIKLTHPAIIQFSQQMEKAGLLNTRKNSSDARKRELYLTEQGNTTYQRIVPLLDAINRANRNFLEQTGAPVLQLLDSMEQQLATKSMHERVLEELAGNNAKGKKP